MNWLLNIGYFQTPLPEQEGPDTGTAAMLEIMSSRDIAYQLTLFDWELFSCLHEVYLTYLFDSIN